jgi:N-acetyl-gamma-glutamyl-phosphate reductase
VLYWCGSRSEAEAYFARLDIPEDLKIIDLSGSHNLDHGEDRPWKYGLSEMQRRVLVHDARLVTVPGNVATASLLAVMPMARNLLLNSPLELHVALGVSALGDADVDLDDLARNQRQEIVMALEQCQSSFGQPVTLTVTRLDERRTLAVAARFKCGVAGEMIRQLYAQYYDDHNFVFMVDRPIVTADIENTNKCLIRIDKDEARGLLTIHAVMDALLKGSAGTAVHAMNLLFGLHEKVGLAFKGTGC